MAGNEPSGWTSPGGGRYRRTHRFGIYACLECGALVTDAEPDNHVPTHDAFHAALRSAASEAEWGRTHQWRRNAVKNLHLYFYILGSLCFLAGSVISLVRS